MLKKLAIIGACAALAVAGITASAPSEATTGYYFASVCSVPNPIDCPIYPSVSWYGPYATQAQCIAAHDNVAANSVFGRWPYVLSTCTLR